MRENRIVFEITDLTHVRLVCTKCESTTFCALDNHLPPPAQCPACRNAWWSDPPGENIAAVAVLNALRAQRDTQSLSPKRPVELRLEFLSDKD